MGLIFIHPWLHCAPKLSVLPRFEALQRYRQNAFTCRDWLLLRSGSTLHLGRGADRQDPSRTHVHGTDELAFLD